AKALAGAQVDEKAMAHTEAIIQSMTPKERDNPSIINYSRKKRIAAGCGLGIEEINKLLKQFEMMQKMTKQLVGMQKRGKKKKRGGFPGFGNFKLPF
ncbi:MAG: signal recognition particle protein, partial [Butyricicoccus sp.]